MTNLRTIAMGAIAASLLAGCGMDPESRYERAVESFASHDLASARLDLISALDEKPGDPEMLLLLARTQIGLGDGEGAAATLQRLAKVRDDVEETRVLKATADILRGKPDAALEGIANDSSVMAERARALAHIAKGNYEDADAALSRGLEAEGPKAEIQATAARFALGRGDLEKARILVAASLQENPELLDALMARGQIETAARKLPVALGAYDKALALHPGHMEAMIARVGVLGDMGKLEDAKAQLENVARAAPDRPDILYLRARFAGEDGDWDKAREMLQPHEKAVRENAGLQVLYARALLETGQIEQARSWIMPVVRRYPGQRLARLVQGEAQLRAGEARNALATLSVLADRPDATKKELQLATTAAKRSGDARAAQYSRRIGQVSPEGLAAELAKADTAMREGRWRDAAESYRTIGEVSQSANPLVLNNHAYAEGELGNHEKAIALAMRAVELSPENPSILDTAGWLLVETGRDVKRGRTLLEKAARLAPENRTIADHLRLARSAG